MKGCYKYFALIVLLSLLVSLVPFSTMHAQDGTAYIIVHVHNPEGVEIASIQGMNPKSVVILDGSTIIGYGASSAETHNSPIAVAPGSHTITVQFNGMTLQRTVELAPSETREMVFEFPRTSVDCSNLFSKAGTAEGSNSQWYNSTRGGYVLLGNHVREVPEPYGIESDVWVRFNAISGVPFQAFADAKIDYSIDNSGLSVTTDVSFSAEASTWVVDVGGQFWIRVPVSGAFPQDCPFITWFVQNPMACSPWSPSVTLCVSGDTNFSRGACIVSPSENSLIVIPIAEWDHLVIYPVNWGEEVGNAEGAYSTEVVTTRQLPFQNLTVSSVPYDLTGTGVGGGGAEDQPPVASFTYSPQNPVVGQEITFDASSSYDTDGQIVSYNWDFGDGNTAEGDVVTHAYTNPGMHTATLTVTDDDGLSDTAQVPLLVTMPPVASFTYSPSNPMVGGDISFDASTSYDPDGQIVSYNWDFGDESSGEGPAVTRTYSEAGNHTVTLTVIDNDGLQDSTSQIVEIRPVPVIFVHGYYADLFRPGSEMWQSMITYLKNNGYGDKDLFPFELEPGVLPANGDITRYAGRLSTEINRVKSLTGATKVDLVCHSMGGLVARWYTTHGYNNDVRKLIMIGTPNHGSELLYPWNAPLFLSLLGVPAGALGPAGYEMTPYSPFLNTLNYGSPYLLTGIDLTNTSIQHEVIAGNQSWWWTSWILQGQNDGVVRVESARLDGVGLRTVPYNHLNECQAENVSAEVLAILQDDPTAVQRSSTLMQAQQGNSTIQEAPMISDKIFSGEQKSHSITISATSEATFALAWLSGDLDLTLTTPSGTTIDPSVAEGNSSISYYQDGNTTIKGYTVQNPEPGIWQVNISAVDVSSEGTDP